MTTTAKLLAISNKTFSATRRRATNRLILRTSGEIAKRFNTLATELSRRIVSAAGDDNKLDQIEVQFVRGWYVEQVAAAFAYVDTLIRKAMEQAGRIGLAQLGWEHGYFFKTSLLQQEGEREAVSAIIRKQSADFVNAATSRYYGDARVNYSQRIWQQEQKARARFDAVMLNAITTGKSAWETAETISSFLRVGAECPEWTEERLYGKTYTQDFAPSKSPCTGQDRTSPTVAYNALRLARTEIAWTSGEATRTAWRNSPFVLGVNVELSPSHPESDICDQVVANNPHALGEALAPSSTMHVPIHPNCLCTEISELPERDEGVDRVRAWIGGATDTGLDNYATYLGFSSADIATPIALEAITGALLDTLIEWIGDDAKLHGDLLGI